MLHQLTTSLLSSEQHVNTGVKTVGVKRKMLHGIVTATGVGDGSELTGVSGFATALC